MAKVYSLKNMKKNGGRLLRMPLPHLVNYWKVESLRGPVRVARRCCPSGVQACQVAGQPCQQGCCGADQASLPEAQSPSERK